jgi:hypothetical protein
MIAFAAKKFYGACIVCTSQKEIYVEGTFAFVECMLHYYWHKVGSSSLGNPSTRAERQAQAVLWES